MEKFIVAGGCAIAVRDTEVGERAILLLHGYLESADVWEPFARALSKEYRVVTIDIPGHGISQIKGEVHTMAFVAAVAADAMHVLGIERYAVVGHSMGGYVALEMLRIVPEHMTALVLFHSSPNADSEQKKEHRMREIALIDAGKKELLSKTAPQLGFAPENLRRLKEHIQSLSEQIWLTEDDGIKALLRGMMQREDTNELMRTSKVPQLMIFGRKDTFITPEIAQSIIDAQPQAKVVWLENSAHNGFWEEPELSLEAIQFFLSDKR